MADLNKWAENPGAGESIQQQSMLREAHTKGWLSTCFPWVKEKGWKEKLGSLAGVFYIYSDLCFVLDFFWASKAKS